MATPNLASLPSILFLLLGKQPPVADVSDEVVAGTWSLRGKCQNGITHRRIFTLGALRELLEYHGFKVERSVSSGYLPFPSPLAKIMCFIDKRHATNIVVKARKTDYGLHKLACNGGA